MIGLEYNSSETGSSDGTHSGNNISIVVPVYQNELNIDTTIPSLLNLGKQLEEMKLSLFFVDDGSTDHSWRMLCEWREKYPDQIHLIKLSRNFGQNTAIRVGLRYATGACVAIISCDLQEPLEKIPEMILEWKKGAKLVVGERVEREEDAFSRFFSQMFWNLMRWNAFPDFPQMGFDFCLLDRQIINDLNGINERNTHIFILTWWLGYKAAKVPIQRAVRKAGVSQWHLAKKLRLVVDCLIGFTNFPARLITYTACTMAMIFLAYLCVTLVIWMLSLHSPPGWMTLIGLLCLLGATILFALGIISEYLLRILDETRKRPFYIIDTTRIKNESR